MTKEALKLAQIALDDIEHQRFSWRRFDALVAIKQALAQPAQEPVGSVVRWVDGSLIHGWFGDPPPEGTLLYITPPQRPWVGLTDEEIADCAEKMEASDPTDSFWREFFRGIEAKLKEKNT